MFTYFRHEIIKRVVIGIGTLFNDIYIAKIDENDLEVERIKVPLSYGPKQKFIVRADQTNTSLVQNFAMDLPRLSLELRNITYDLNRKTQSTRKLVEYQSGEDSSMKTRLERVPYTLDFNLHILTKRTEDAFQIIEQILPTFTPDYTISFNDWPIEKVVDVPIVLGSVLFDEDYEGTFYERKVFAATIKFAANVYMYGPVKSSGIIKQTQANFINYSSLLQSGSSIYRGFDYPTYSITGATFSSVILSVTGGATAGSIGNTGTIDTRVVEY